MIVTQFIFMLAAPEVFLLVCTAMILLFGVFCSPLNRSSIFFLTLFTLLGIMFLIGAQCYVDLHGHEFHGLYKVDELSHLLKFASTLTVLITLVYGRLYAQARDMLRGGEFYVLTLLALLGQMIMISAGNLIIIYLGLELMSLAIYALIALQRDHPTACEAAMKYFILGALASGFLLYGMSMLYGATGYLDLGQISHAITEGRAQHLILVFAIVFLLSGLAFKLGVAPFHSWVPDVYQGSPTVVTLILGGIPKLAAFTVFLRLFGECLYSLAFSWQPMLLILGVLSLAIGNLTAIMQTNFKRMLAYSSISHMGFVLLGLACGAVVNKPELTINAYGISLFYILSYVLMTLGSFGMILLLSKSGFECENIEDIKGLNQRSPWHAAVLLLLMLSLAGLPPLVGFQAKLAILELLVSADHIILAVLVVIFSLIGAFYYLRVMKVMYFDKAETDLHLTKPTYGQYGVMSINSALVLGLGLLPGGLIGLCLYVISSSLRF